MIEDVGNRLGHVIRSVFSSRNEPEKKREKSLLKNMLRALPKPGGTKT